MKRLLTLSYAFLLPALALSASSRVKDFSSQYTSNPITHPRFPQKLGERHSYLILEPVPENTAIRDSLLEMQGKMNFFRYNPMASPTPTQLKTMQKNLLNAYALMEPSVYNEQQINALKNKDPMSISELLAGIAAKLLVEPRHANQFKNVFNGKRFYFPAISSPPHSSPWGGISFGPLPTLQQAVAISAGLAQGQSCNPELNSCQAGFFCQEAPSPPMLVTTCREEDSPCSQGSQCCSGRCERIEQTPGQFAYECAANTRCYNCTSDGNIKPPGASCCPGLRGITAVDEDGESDVLCIGSPQSVNDGTSAYSFKMDANSCSPELVNPQDLGRFERNERVLFAFEYLFNTYPATSRPDRYQHLESIKPIAQSFSNYRINSKKSYESAMHQINQELQVLLRSHEGQDHVRNSAALGGHYLTLFIQKQQITMARDKARFDSYPQLKSAFSSIIQKIRRFKWKKKKWFKPNRCKKWKIKPIRGKNHKKCYTKTWQVPGSAPALTPSGLAKFLKGSDLMAPLSAPQRMRHLTDAQYPRQCQTDPVFPGNAGFNIGRGTNLGSLSSVRQKIQTGLQGYGSKPKFTATNQANGPSSILDQTITLHSTHKDEQDRPYTPMEDLSDVVIRSMLSYGQAASCRNNHTAKSKIAYLQVVLDAIEEVSRYYQSSSTFWKNSVIPCLEGRRQVLSSRTCDVNDPNSDCHVQCSEDDPSCQPSDPPPCVGDHCSDSVCVGDHCDKNGDDDISQNVCVGDHCSKNGDDDTSGVVCVGDHCNNNGNNKGNNRNTPPSFPSPINSISKLIGKQRSGSSSIKTQGNNSEKLTKGDFGQGSFQQRNIARKSKQKTTSANKDKSLAQSLQDKLSLHNSKGNSLNNSGGGKQNSLIDPNANPFTASGQLDSTTTTDNTQQNKSLSPKNLEPKYLGQNYGQNMIDDPMDQSDPPPLQLPPDDPMASAINHTANSTRSHPQKGDSLFKRINKAYQRKAFPALLIKRIPTSKPPAFDNAAKKPAKEPGK